jgi:putative membrane protein
MASLAQQMNVKTPQPLNSTHKVEAQRLASMSGTSFDREYLKAMDADHHKTLAMFKNEEATTTNPDLKTAVSQGLAVIQQHTDMADQLSQKMGVPTAPAM